MHTWHKAWKEEAEQLDRLLVTPRRFVWQHGHSYNLWPEAGTAFYQGARILAWVCIAVLLFILVASWLA